MKGEDVIAIREILNRNPMVRGVDVVGPSAGPEEVDLVRETWGVDLVPISQSTWDLMDPPPEAARGDVALICNTFMCSVDPDRWLQNIAEAVDFAIIQDYSKAPRRQDRITSPETGDYQRYSVSSHGVVGLTDPDANPVYDLSKSGATVVDCLEYFPIGDGQLGKFVVILDLRSLGRNERS